MTQKQTKLLLYIILILSLMLIVYCCLLFAFSNKGNNLNNKSIADKAEATQVQSTDTIKPDNTQVQDDKYMLKSQNDRVCVYEVNDDGSYKFVNEININPKYMRRLDQKSLQNGIVVNSNEELLCLIEDFSS